MRIGIIGGGFTGCMLAVQLLRQAKPGTTITIVERAESFGLGAAYGTMNPEHLLNVRSGNMGAFPDDPGHFQKWLVTHDKNAPAASAFVSRMRYGAYVSDVFQNAIVAAAGKVPVSLVTGIATGLEPASEPRVMLADGRRLAFDRLALCFGNLPPADAPGLTEVARASGRYIHDPWRGHELGAIPVDADVLIVGSGLTMADMVQSLAGQEHRGPIKVFSRHGLVPFRHEAPSPVPIERPAGSLTGMFRSLRAAAKAAPARGGTWRDVIDALRPWTGEVWKHMTSDDRRRFLRHVRAHWEVLRHRLAPDIADTLDRLQSSGQLTVAAARILSIDWHTDRFEVVARPRGTNESVRLAPAWVINCTGPQGDYEKTSNPLVRSAVEAGALRADSLQLSLDVTGEGAVIDARGRASENIFALGPPTRSAFWEITAVPDIRTDCLRMAGVLLKDQ